MQQNLSKLIFNSISDGVFTVDRDCTITSFNKAAEEITGFQAAEAMGKYCFEIFRTEFCHKRCALKDTLKNHDPVENVRVTILTREGCELTVNVTTTLLRDERDNIVGAVEFFRDISELEHLRMRLDQKKALGEIISVNPEMQQLVQLLPDIAESECNVLIQGASGSGKELFAQIIHNLSPRKYGPYIKINCGALPETLLESELFGYEKGAFTDAKRDKPGQFCLANGGTLLLDEVGEMEISLQVKLLRVLNNGEYRPLGSAKSRQTDARIIAATNADLQAVIADGRFRQDLFYRLNVVNIEIPSLRERPEDIPLLVNHFLKAYRKKTRKNINRISPAAIAALRKYSFPGNVRELENAIEHAFVMCREVEMQLHDLPASIVEQSNICNGITLVKESEKNVILEALRRNNGNKSKTAVELGVHRSTMWRKIRTYGISA